MSIVLQDRIIIKRLGLKNQILGQNIQNFVERWWVKERPLDNPAKSSLESFAKKKGNR